jgi:arginase
MYQLIGAATGWGAQIRACEEGPEILQESGIVEKLKGANIAISSWKTLYPEKRARDESIPLSLALPLVHQFNLSLAEAVRHALAAKAFPIVLGGDHSIAVGTWNGVYQHCKKEQSLPLGLIWVDAHMDAHTPETTPSGAWHGMPLAGLMGHGDPKMAHLIEKAPVLLPENVCLIGTRSFEKGEAELLQRLNVRIFFMDEVRAKGMHAVMREAITHVKRGTKRFGVSLDLDVMSPEEAPGVGSPEEDGIPFKELLKGLAHLPYDPAFVAFELVEYNPRRNHHARTAHLCHDILYTVMKHG